LAIVSLSVMPVFCFTTQVVLIESQGLNSSFWGTSWENPSTENEKMRWGKVSKLSTLVVLDAFLVWNNIWKLILIGKIRYWLFLELEGKTENKITHKLLLITFIFFCLDSLFAFLQYIIWTASIRMMNTHSSCLK